MVLISCRERHPDCAVPRHGNAPDFGIGIRSVRGRGRLLSSMLAAVSTLALSAAAAQAGEVSPSRPGDGAAVQALMAKLDAMEHRINNLQVELKDAKAKKTTGSVGQSASLASRRTADAAAQADVKGTQAGPAKASDNAQSSNAMASADPKDTRASGAKTSDGAQQPSPISRLVAAFADSDPKPRFMPAADLKAPPARPGGDLFGVAPSTAPGTTLGLYG